MRSLSLLTATRVVGLLEMKKGTLMVILCKAYFYSSYRLFNASIIRFAIINQLIINEN